MHHSFTLDHPYRSEQVSKQTNLLYCCDKHLNGLSAQHGSKLVHLPHRQNKVFSIYEECVKTCTFCCNEINKYSLTGSFKKPERTGSMLTGLKVLTVFWNIIGIQRQTSPIFGEVLHIRVYN